MLPESKRIIDKAIEQYGSPEQYQAALYGPPEEKLGPEEVRYGQSESYFYLLPAHHKIFHPG